MTMTAAITGQLHDVLNAHATGEQGDRQEETNDEDGDQHENPCDGFESTVAKSLKDAGTETPYNEPPENRVETAGQQMIDDTGDCNQKNSCGCFTKSKG